MIKCRAHGAIDVCSPSLSFQTSFVVFDMYAWCTGDPLPPQCAFETHQKLMILLAFTTRIITHSLTTTPTSSFPFSVLTNFSSHVPIAPFLPCIYSAVQCTLVPNHKSLYYYQGDRPAASLALFTKARVTNCCRESTRTLCRPGVGGAWLRCW